MESRKKLQLTANKAIVVDSFAHPLPRGFGGNASEETLMHTWLPGLKSKQKWEDDAGLSGVKMTIRDNIQVIRTRVEIVITTRLAGYPEAAALARELLADTVSFITSLSEFISKTYVTLHHGQFTSKDAWNLVSKLVHWFFATNCYLKRGLANELLDATDHKSLACGTMWGTFGTHQVMREYAKYNIKNHPLMASEYVRFLVTNCGLEKICKLENKCKALEDKNAVLSRQLEEVAKMATTASNKADEAKKLASKSK